MNGPLFSRSSFAAVALVAAGVLSGCSTTAPELAGKNQLPAVALQNPSALLDTWVVLGEQGQPVARAVTSAAECPVLLQDGTADSMQVRARPETIAQRKTASSPDNSKPSAFPVMVCEAPLKPGISHASIAGRELAVPKATVQKIVVIGDTGCRMKLADNYFQSCNDSDKWAFRRMVQAAAQTHPDLVIHVGDYHYRENACPDGNPACAGSPWGYGWDTWKADFFDPAKALLQVAPWVMVRGNHESCLRAGQGWWRLLDPRPLQAGRDCNLAENDQKGDYSAPYAVPLGKVGNEAAQLIVFDSSKVPNKVLAKEDVPYRTYMEQFKTVNALAAKADFNIFMNHHPILGFGVEKKKDGQLSVWPGNAALQDVLQNLNAMQLFPSQVQATLSGHVHLFEALTFSSGHPTQFVSGNGGSSLDMPLPATAVTGKTPYSAAALEHFSNSNDVGFMTMERELQSWKIQAWNTQGKLITECRMQNRKTVCRAVNS
ncbi:metallophosphoesterase family protein [Undibacterium griseum]|uniref:Metallophosphoesterase n=1 Tax=Undibacterium griseum TaxID=2762295 RepID=A0ABR6YIQ7_9BURK|nr:metallophosphoesterase [Undibacterium griseum]MBC3883708.1 metallophosphoesterase [Undibacterium griseum]